MPEGVDLYGLYNKVHDWNAVKEAKIEFAWVKLSDGGTDRGDYGYVKAGHDVGIAMGGYHYAQPGNPVAQADRLIDQCLRYGAVNIAPALDLEAPFVPGTVAINFAVGFLHQIEARGHTPCLYANNSMLNGVLRDVRREVPNVKVWGARYGGDLTVPHDVHQYTSTGRVPGIAGDVDRNRGLVLWNHSGGGGSAPGVPAPAPAKPITPTPTRNEENVMLAKASNDDYISVPCDGKRSLFIASGFGRTVKVLQVSAVKDTQGGGPAFTSAQQIGGIDSDRPGPIAIGADCRVVQLRYSADHDFTVWCA